MSNDLFSSNESEIKFDGSEVTVIQLNSVLQKNIYENLHIECNFKSCNTILGSRSSNPSSVSSCSLAAPTPESNYLHDPSTTTVHKLTTCLSVHQHNHDKATCNQHVPSEPATVLQLDQEDSVNVSNEDLDTLSVNEPIKIPLPSPENKQALNEDEEVVPDNYQIEI